MRADGGDRSAAWTLAHLFVQQGLDDEAIAVPGHQIEQPVVRERRAVIGVPPEHNDRFVDPPSIDEQGGYLEACGLVPSVRSGA